MVIPDRTPDPAVTPDAAGVLWLETCASTNDVAWEHSDDPRITAVVAARQTAGRGRRGRAWASPAAGLYLSWPVRPRLPAEQGPILSLLAAVALAETVAAWGVGRDLWLKWPNDLWLGQGKLAGILTEARTRGPEWSAVVGVGLNLRAPAGGWPPGVPAVALDAALGGAIPSPAAAARALLPRLTAWLQTVEAEGAVPVLAAWQRFAPPPGTRFEQAGREGVFAGLAPDGGLRLTDAAGVTHTLRTGEVELVTAPPPSLKRG